MVVTMIMIKTIIVAIIKIIAGDCKNMMMTMMVMVMMMMMFC